LLEVALEGGPDGREPRVAPSLDRQHAPLSCAGRVERSGAMARGPGPVAAVHRILIVAALVCALVYAGWEGMRYRETGETFVVARAALAVMVAIAIAAYLRSLRDLGEKLTPRE